MYMYIQSLRQDKARQLYIPKDNFAFQAQLEFTTFCVLERPSTNQATETAQLGRLNL